jgi:hypothetical protein
MVETNNIKTFQHYVYRKMSRLTSSGQTSPVSNNLPRTFEGFLYEIAENISLIFILFRKNETLQKKWFTCLEVTDLYLDCFDSVFILESTMPLRYSVTNS